MQRAHIVQSVGEFDQQHANVIRNGEQELAQVFRRAFVVGLRLNLRQFGDAINQSRDLRAEFDLDFLHRGQRILHRVVEQGGDDGFLIQFQVGHQTGDLNRMAEIRVTAGAFLAAVGEAGSVRNVSENAQNITSSYIDVESRLAALEAQRTRLNELADQAETTADLLEIESQLSDVQYQLENYTRQLRNMDQQVSYSTVDIYLEEVATLTPTGVTFTERIADAFGGGWDAFVGFVQGLVIALVYLWPVVLIAVVVVFILRKVWKKRPKKEKLPKPAQTPPPAEYPVKPSDEPKPKY